jgi:predicted RNase H-like nuclease (RuvC/YqgF family)
MDLKEKILVALGLAEEEIKLGWQGKSDDGTIFVSTAEELEAGVDFSVLTEDGTTILAPIGTYLLESGVSVRIEEEGIVAEVIQSETEEEDTTEEVEAAEESPAEEADWAKSFEELKDKVENLEDAIADIKAKIGGDDEAEDMSEATEPSTNPSTNPRTKTTKTTETIEFSVEELKAENEKLKAELAEQPAEAPINTNKFSSERPTPTKQDFRRMTKQEKFLYELHK